MRQTKLIIIFCIIVLGTEVYSQEPPGSINAERPGVTTSALTLEKQYLQIETGFVYEKNHIEDNNSGYNIGNYSIAETLFRYGLIEGLELRVGAGYLNRHVSDVNGEVTYRGFSGLLVGWKIQFFKADSTFNNIALTADFHLPVGNDLFTSHNTEPELILAYEPRMPDYFNAGFNIGADWNPDLEAIFYRYSAALSYSISNSFGIYIEHYGEVTDFDFPRFNADGGFTYLLVYNLQFDASAGFDLSDPARDYFINAGVALRLPD